MLAAEIKKKLLIIIVISTVSAFSVATPLILLSLNRGTPDPDWIPGYNIKFDDEVTFNFFENKTRSETIGRTYNYYGFGYDLGDSEGGFPHILDFSRINIVDILVNGTVDSGKCQGWNIEIKPGTYHNANLRLFYNYQNRSMHTIANTSLVFNPPAHWEGLGITEDLSSNLKQLFYTEIDYYAAKYLQMTFWMHAEYPEYYDYAITLRPWFNLTFTVRFTYKEGYYPQEPKFPNWVGPKLLKSYTDLFDYEDIYMQGSRIYHTLVDGYFRIYDNSDPFNIQFIGQYYSSNDFHPQEITVDGDVAYLSNQGYGLVLLDVSNPSNIRELSRIETVDGGLTSVRDNILYLTNGRSITTINVTNPEAPVVMGDNTTTDLGANWMQLHGDLAYIGIGYNMAIFNVSDPYNPKELRYFNVSSPWYPDEAWAVDYGLIVDDILYAANDNSGFLVYNIADPMHLVLIDSIRLPVERMVMDGSILYAVNYHGVTIIDAAYPSNLVLLNDLDFDESDHHRFSYLNYQDGLLYGLEYYDGRQFHIFDTGFDSDDDGISDYEEV